MKKEFISSQLKKNFSHDSNWFKLDNAGKIYPAILSKRITTLFRLSVTLKEPINIDLLQKALNSILPRFPYYKVSLKSGLFWYFLETNHRNPMIEGDSLYPCMGMPLKKKGMFLLRIRVYKNRIALECSHILTDGNGAMIFLLSLLRAYLQEKGVSLSPLKDKEKKYIFSQDESINAEESQDAFLKYFNPKLPPSTKGAKAYHLKHKIAKKGIYFITTGESPLEPIKKKAKEYKATVTEFIIAVLINSYQQLMKEDKKKKPIRINTPVNLRTLYPSRTMRNFFLSVEPWIDPRLGEYSFSEIVSKVHHYMQYEVDTKFLNQQITRNIKGELNWINRLFPLSLKNRILPVAYTLLGEKNYTGSLSNLGIVNLPFDMIPYIETFDFYPPPSEGNKIKTTLLSYNNKVKISFGSIIKSTELERIFFTSLRKMDIPVKIESNRFY